MVYRYQLRPRVSRGQFNGINSHPYRKAGFVVNIDFRRRKIEAGLLEKIRIVSSEFVSAARKGSLSRLLFLGFGAGEGPFHPPHLTHKKYKAKAVEKIIPVQLYATIASPGCCFSGISSAKMTR